MVAYTALTYVPYDTPHSDTLRSPSARRMASMSRASLRVLMLRSTGPSLARHFAARLRAFAALPEMSPSGAGQDWNVVAASCGWLRPHDTGLLAPVPRGSKPTRSYASRTAAGSLAPQLVGVFTPELPGPPGTSTSTRRRFAGSALASRDTARSRTGPP